MNILYITKSNCDTFEDGATRKILSQVKAFFNIGNNVDFIHRYQNRIKKNDVFISTQNKYIDNILFFLILKKNLDFSKYNLIYIRYISCSLSQLLFLKYINKFFVDIKVVIEIPTYPYDGEISKKGISFYRDFFFRKYLKYFVYKIVTFSEDKYIFDIPCINIANGIDLNNIEIINPCRHSEKIIFTSVSAIEEYHGIDRFLASLYNCDEDLLEKIEFNIVGEGNALNILKEFVDGSLKLKNCVYFHGYKSGKTLDKIYNRTNIAVGSLARHRANICTIRPLKNIEYAAKGLPMIFSEDDPGFRDSDYVYKVQPNEDLFDINEIINWYYRLELAPKDIRNTVEQFSWEEQLKKVLKQIEIH